MLTQSQKIHILSMAYKDWLKDNASEIDKEWEYAIWRDYEKKNPISGKGTNMESL